MEINELEVKEEKLVDSKTALSELKTFLKKHLKKEFRRGKMTDEKIKEDYIDVLEAIEDGFVVITDCKPVYTLREPIFKDAEDKSLVISSVNFRARIKEAEKALVMDGLDLEKQRGTYVIKLMSYMTQLSITSIKQLEKEDFNTINQIGSVF